MQAANLFVNPVMKRRCITSRKLLWIILFAVFGFITTSVVIYELKNEKDSTGCSIYSTDRGRHFRRDVRPPAPANDQSPYLRPNFEVALDFRFPHPVLYRPVDVILKTSWVRKLKWYLSSVNPSRQVIVTEATYDFIKNLVNWLISAAIVSEVPLQNVLVLCFDQHTYDSLAERKINSLYIPYYSLLRNPKLEIGNIWMSRLAVIRLLSHWGYDVQHYDTDAVLLKNPQPLFQRFPSSDIVASRGDYPDELGKNGPWGTTLCMGAVLIRSSPRTGELYLLATMTTADTVYLLSCMSYSMHVFKQTKQAESHRTKQSLITIYYRLGQTPSDRLYNSYLTVLEQCLCGGSSASLSLTDCNTHGCINHRLSLKLMLSSLAALLSMILDYLTLYCLCKTSDMF